MNQLRYRVALIAGLVLASIWALWPRTVVERVKRDGVFVYDTVQRVPLKKGLDLEGGMYLRLEIDESKGAIVNRADALDRALKVVRTRIDEFGVAEPVVQKVGNDRIEVELPGIDDPERAEAVVQKTAFLQFMITDDTRALERSLPRLDQIARDAGSASPDSGAQSDSAGARQPSRLQSLFTTADSARAAGDSAAADSAAPTPVTGGIISGLLQAGQLPGEYFIAEQDVSRAEYYFSLPQIQAALPPGKTVKWGTDTIAIGGDVYRTLYVLDAREILGGEYIQDANPNETPIDGTVVEFTLNNEGGRRFRSETAKHIQDYMAIVLDDRVMGRPPIIQSAIGTRGQITLGRRNLQQAQDLALVLRAGALPVPLRIAETRNIGASLGEDSIRRGTTAMFIAVSLVVVVMLVYYRFSGLLAVMGLVLFVLYTMAVLAGFGAVVTLPGLAGLVLSVGMAVDANVLIFERIREELDRGKTVRTAIDEGFHHAISAIVDTSVTTILTATVLYQYGTGAVRGFAVTLIAGIAASVFAALFVVRTFYLLWLTRTRGAQTLSI